MSTFTRKTLLNNTLKKRKPQFALRMAPLIDIIFLLLIFFLVTANFRPQENFLPIQLSNTANAALPLAKPEPLEIHIMATESGCDIRIGHLYTISINDNSLEEDLTVLFEKIQLTLKTQKRNTSDPIEIICSENVKWRHLARIYNLFHGSGLTDIAFRMTEQ